MKFSSFPPPYSSAGVCASTPHPALIPGFCGALFSQLLSVLGVRCPKSGRHQPHSLPSAPSPAQELDTSDEGGAELEVLTLTDKTQQPDLQTGPN